MIASTGIKAVSDLSTVRLVFQWLMMLPNRLAELYVSMPQPESFGQPKYFCPVKRFW